MEGKAPWSHNRNGKKAPASKKELAAASTESPPSYSPAANNTPPSMSDPNTSHRCELSFAMIEELTPKSLPTAENLACITQHIFSTILDSGTTSTLITDRSNFWTYSTDSSVMVTTANHGKLLTSGRGDCVAELTINSQVLKIRLSNCLHAPGALVNLLSVGQMLRKGWECNFKPFPSRCQPIYCGERCWVTYLCLATSSLLTLSSYPPTVRLQCPHKNSQHLRMSPCPGMFGTQGWAISEAMP